MNEQIVQLQQEFEEKLAAVTAAADLEEIRIAFLGKNGSVTSLTKQMGKLSPEEKKTFGQQVNQLKNACTEKINERQAALAKADEAVAASIEGKTIVKEISVPNKIVNIVVR